MPALRLRRRQPPGALRLRRVRVPKPAVLIPTTHYLVLRFWWPCDFRYCGGSDGSDFLGPRSEKVDQTDWDQTRDDTPLKSKFCDKPPD